jgi:hypothetical protein
LCVGVGVCCVLVLVVCFGVFEWQGGHFVAGAAVCSRVAFGGHFVATFAGSDGHDFRTDANRHGGRGQRAPGLMSKVLNGTTLDNFRYLFSAWFFTCDSNKLIQQKLTDAQPTVR